MDNLWIWLVVSTYPSEKCEFVNWDDEHSKIYGKLQKKMFQLSNQTK